MVCNSCGATNSGSVKFCSECGRPVSPADLSQTVVLEKPIGAAPAAPLPRAQVEAGVLSPPPEPLPSAATFNVGRAPATAPAILQPGSSFGPRYRIEALLGEGGMGAVYKVYDAELDRAVALKVIRPELATSALTLQRFKQELLLASKVSHKNVLRIHDLGDMNGVKYITMAYVDGSDLAHLIEKSGRLSFDRAMRFTRQLCAALEAAHNEGVVHRDLKPQNILIDQSDNLYVSDFGLAKSLESDSPSPMMTRTGQLMGTPRYMSPEQVEAGQVDHRSDLYALGLIMYEMFTSDTPFRADTVFQVMYQRITETPKDPRTVCPELPAYVASVILKCLEKNPDKRYYNAREILADLETEHAPTISAPAPAKTIHIQIPHPSRAWVAISAGIAIVALAGVLTIPGTRHWILHSSAAGQTAGQTATTLRRLAVLPFRLIGDPEKNQYLADGVVDTLSAKLGGLKDVYVASTNAVNGLTEKQDPYKTLGVTQLVRGTVQNSGNRVAVTISLDDSSGRNLLHQPFEGQQADFLTLEDQIFNSLVNALAIQRSDDELARSSSRPTEDIGAYELYLKGMNLLRRAQNVQSLERAAQLYDQAIQVDHRFALAYAGLADTYHALWDRTKDSSWMQKALGAAQEAQALNDNLPEVHFALGSLYGVTGRTAQAIVELHRALDLAPNSDEALRLLGHAYLAAGQRKEGIAAYLQATQVNPYYWNNFNPLGIAYFGQGQNEKALEAFRRVTELEPDRASGYANAGAVYFREGKWAECVPLFQKAIALQPTPVYYSNLGTTFFFLGRYADAVQMFEKAVALEPNEVMFRGNLADAYRWSNQAEKAEAAYQEAIKAAYKAQQLAPKNAEILGDLAVFYAKTKNDDRAVEFIRRAREIDASSNVLMYKEATVRALAGRTGDALASLRQALRNGYSIKEAESDPELKALQKDPEFKRLVAEVSSSQR